MRYAPLERPACARLTCHTAHVVLAGLLLGCAEATAPHVYVQPELALLQVNDFFSVLRDSGFVAVLAVPSDSFYRLAANERVRVQLTSTSGDSEALDLELVECGIWQDILCNDLMIGMRDGHSAYELTPLLETIPARFLAVWAGGRGAAVHVLRSDRVVHAIRRIGAHPGVRGLYRAGFSTPAAGRASPSVLSASVPFDFASPVPGDGHVQARSGDRLTLTYLQPDGTTVGSAFQLQ